jgi:hypothetical protein
VLAHHNLNAGCFVCWSEALKCFEGLKRFEKFLKKKHKQNPQPNPLPFSPFQPGRPTGPGSNPAAGLASPSLTLLSRCQFGPARQPLLLPLLCLPLAASWGPPVRTASHLQPTPSSPLFSSGRRRRPDLPPLAPPLPQSPCLGQLKPGFTPLPPLLPSVFPNQAAPLKAFKAGPAAMAIDGQLARTPLPLLLPSL